MQPAASSPTHAASLSRWFAALAVVTWIQIAFGALVRAKKAGLACPDWPLCFGEVVPNLRLEGVVYEYGHRVFALVVSALFVRAAWGAWQDPQTRGRVGRWIRWATVVLLVQIVFGGLTVLVVHRGDGAPRPAAWTVSTHLILGNLFAALAAVTSATLARTTHPSGTDGTPALPRTVRPLLGLWTASVLLQFVLGGIIAGNIAGLVCTEFPTCNGGIWFPSFSGFVGAQVLHRLNAYLLLLTALTLAWTTRQVPRLSTPTKLLAVLVLMQGTVGAINIVSYLHTAVTTAHSLLAALVFSATAWLWTRVREHPSVSA